MNSIDPYELLEVAHDATLEVIHASYIRLVRLNHPDRFDATKKPEEWKKANQKMSALNQAYASIRDGSAYKSKRHETTTDDSDEEVDEAPEPQVWFSKGHSVIEWDRLYPEARALLTRRALGQFSDDFRYKYDGPVWRLLILLASCAWLPWLFAWSKNESWSGGTDLFAFGVTAIVAIVQGSLLRWLINWKQSVLGCQWILTPLYLVITNRFKATYWPLWELKDINVVHQHRNGIYTHSEVNLNFASGNTNTNIRPKKQAEKCLREINARRNHILNAINNNDRKFFYLNDDLRTLNRELHKSEGRQFWAITPFVIFAVPWLSIFAYALTLNYGYFPITLPKQTAAMDYSDRKQSEAQTQKKLANQRWSQLQATKTGEPKEPRPINGFVIRSTKAECVAPFSIVTSNSDDYFVKLTDQSTGVDVLSIYIHGGETVETLVPLGTYVMKYASGSNWLGTERLFGASTRFNKGRGSLQFYKEPATSRGFTIVGHTVTLTRVRNGNFSTESMDQSDF